MGQDKKTNKKNPTTGWSLNGLNLRWLLFAYRVHRSKRTLTVLYSWDRLTNSWLGDSGEKHEKSSCKVWFVCPTFFFLQEKVWESKLIPDCSLRKKEKKKNPCWFYTLIKLEKSPTWHTKPRRSEQFCFSGVNFHSPDSKKLKAHILFQLHLTDFYPVIARVTSSSFQAPWRRKVAGMQPWRAHGYACGFASFRWKWRSQIVFKELNCTEITCLKLNRQRNMD